MDSIALLNSSITLMAENPFTCGSNGPKQDCFPIRIYLQEHEIIVPAERAICGTIARILLLNLLFKYSIILSVAEIPPPGVCQIRSRPFEQSSL